MPRPQPAALAALACTALLLPASGCYRYDARAQNLTSHDVRVSIHKGTRAREVSTAVLGSGASAGWNGSFNGPVLVRVESAGERVDVDLPRRAHTLVTISDAGGGLSVQKTIGEESWTLTPAGAEPAQPEPVQPEPVQPEPVQSEPAAPEPAAESGEMIDLVEPGEG